MERVYSYNPRACTGPLPRCSKYNRFHLTQNLSVPNVWSKRNVAVLSYAGYVPMLTPAAALRVKAVLSKVAW